MYSLHTYVLPSSCNLFTLETTWQLYVYNIMHMAVKSVSLHIYIDICLSIWSGSVTHHYTEHDLRTLIYKELCVSN